MERRIPTLDEYINESVTFINEGVNRTYAAKVYDIISKKYKKMLKLNEETYTEIKAAVANIDDRSELIDELKKSKLFNNTLKKLVAPGRLWQNFEFLFDDNNILKVMVRVNPGRNPEFAYIEGQNISWSNEEAVLYTLFPDAFDMKIYAIYKSDYYGRREGEYIEFVNGVTADAAKKAAKIKFDMGYGIDEITKDDIKKILADTKLKADEAAKNYETLKTSASKIS